MKKKLSILVLPLKNSVVFNLYCTQLKNILKKECEMYDYEIIFIHNNANNTLWDSIKNICKEDKTIKAIKCTRDFGTTAACSAGYDYAVGDAIIFLHRQYNPNIVIAKAIQKWREGFSCVFSQKITHKHVLLEKLARWFCQRFLSITLYKNILFNFFDHCILLDKKELSHCKDKAINLSQILAHGNYTVITMPKQKKITLTVLFNFGSYLLLSIFATYLIAAHVKILIVFVVGITCVIIPMQICFMWLIHQYIIRIKDQYKPKPLYSVKNLINITSLSAAKNKSIQQEYNAQHVQTSKQKQEKENNNVL